MLLSGVDLRRESGGRARNRHEHCDRGRLAVRDKQDEESRQADHHSNGQLHHWICHLELADPRIPLRTWERFLEISVGLPDL
jgi:hypothetical protein